MKSIRVVISGAAVALMCAATAEASTFSLMGGTAGVISGTAMGNDQTGILVTIGGFFGSQVYVNLAAGAVVRAEFLGAEPAFENALAAGREIRGGDDDPEGESRTFEVDGPGIVPFWFNVNMRARGLVNGQNPDASGPDPVGGNFFASCDPFSRVPGAGGSTCDVVYLFLSDGVKHGHGENDFVIRLTAAPAGTPIGLIGNPGTGVGGPLADVPVIANPEPASLTLLGLGLLLTVRRMRRRE